MKTAYYISPDWQATTTWCLQTHATLVAEGYRRVGFLRWLIHSLRLARRYRETPQAYLQ